MWPPETIRKINDAQQAEYDATHPAEAARRRKEDEPRPVRVPEGSSVQPPSDTRQASTLPVTLGLYLLQRTI